MEELTKEKAKNENLMGEINKINGELANTQKLHRQYHVKNSNWQNFYRDFEFDYYNGLNYHLDHIYWLQDKCRKL